MSENENLNNLIDPVTEQNENEKTPRNKRNVLYIVLLSVLVALLIASVVLVALLSLPVSETERPVIEIGDSNGDWETQAAIAVFDKPIRPGDSGEYAFALKNANTYEMQYSFSLSPHYENGEIEYFPLMFRLKMNNVLMETDEWQSIEDLSFAEMFILPDTTQSFTLEWRWPFESGADEKDTVIGAQGGKITMFINVTAQAR